MAHEEAGELDGRCFVFARAFEIAFDIDLAIEGGTAGEENEPVRLSCSRERRADVVASVLAGARVRRPEEGNDEGGQRPEVFYRVMSLDVAELMGEDEGERVAIAFIDGKNIGVDGDVVFAGKTVKNTLRAK